MIMTQVMKFVFRITKLLRNNCEMKESFLNNNNNKNGVMEEDLSTLLVTEETLEVVEVIQLWWTRRLW